jgi:hypothetical protein
MISESRADVPNHWILASVGQHSLWHDPVLDVAVVSQGESTVLIAGDVVDPRSRAVGSQTIAALAAAALADSEAELAEYLYGVAGRYVVAYTVGSHLNLQSDAGGTRSIFFSSRQPGIASSHPSLVAEATNDAKVPRDFLSDPRFRKGVRYYPGRITPWEHVVFLTPNTRLTVDTGHVERFFPTRDHPSRSTQEAIELAAPVMAAIIELASRGRPSVLSLTAGLDSRTTLACARSVATSPRASDFGTP